MGSEFGKPAVFVARRLLRAPQAITRSARDYSAPIRIRAVLSRQGASLEIKRSLGF
jgi:hypothetical protein